MNFLRKGKGHMPGKGEQVKRMVIILSATGNGITKDMFNNFRLTLKVQPGLVPINL